MTNKLRITQVRSAIGREFNQKGTLKALGIRKLNSTVIKEDTPQIRGMIRKIRHLLVVEEIKEKKTTSQEKKAKPRSTKKKSKLESIQEEKSKKEMKKRGKAKDDEAS